MKPIERNWWTLAMLWLVLLLVFGLSPDVDIWFSGLFYSAEQGFFAQQWTSLQWINTAVPWVGRVILVAAILGCLAAAFGYSGLNGRKWRPISALLLMLVIGIGLVVHVGLKDNWGRARPQDTLVFNGTHRFTPPLQPSNQCQTNCSFVSGHAATGFALLGLGILGSRRRRVQWLTIAMACGVLIGLVRIAVGRHFLSDVLFGGVLMWTLGMVIRWAWVRAIGLRRSPRLPRSSSSSLSPVLPSAGTSQ